MNNQKPFLIAGSIALGVIALSLVFMAGRISSTPERFDRFENFDGNRSKIGSRFDGRESMWNKNGNKNQMMNREMQFIDESLLTDEQKDQLDQIRKDQQEKMQDLMQSYRVGSGSTQTDLKTQIDTLWKEHMTELRQFVPQDQLSGFDAFIEEGNYQIGGMFGQRGFRR